MDVRSRVLTIVADEMSVKPADLADSTRFVEDLGADSLDVVEIVMGVEEEFDIAIPDEDAERLTTVGSLVVYVRGHAK